MITRYIVGAAFLLCSTWAITKAINFWAKREQARQDAERQRLNRIMQASAPRAAGLRRDQRRVS